MGDVCPIPNLVLVASINTLSVQVGADVAPAPISVYPAAPPAVGP